MKTNIKIDFVWVIVGIIVLFVLLKTCEGEPRTITKTETKTIIKTDTVNEVIIKEIPKTVYVSKYIDKQGEKVIVYVDKPNDSTIKANQYDTEIKSNNATAKLKITTSGELYDVSGTITYPEKETTIETIKIRDASGLFLYANLPINNLTQPEVGALFQFKNKMFISGGVQYNSVTRQPDLKVGIGIKIW